VREATPMAADGPSAGLRVEWDDGSPTDSPNMTGSIAVTGGPCE